MTVCSTRTCTCIQTECMAWMGFLCSDVTTQPQTRYSSLIPTFPSPPKRLLYCITLHGILRTMALVACRIWSTRVVRSFPRQSGKLRPSCIGKSQLLKCSCGGRNQRLFTTRYIPLISRVRGPYGKLWTEFFPSFYGPSAKRAGHENKEGKNEDP